MIHIMEFFLMVYGWLATNPSGSEDKGLAAMLVPQTKEANDINVVCCADRIEIQIEI